MQNVVEVENVSKRFKYEKKNFFAVKDVSFTVRKGEIFGLLGPNGAGKTTILNMIVGMLIPNEGRVKIFGSDVGRSNNILEQISMTSGGSQFHGNLRIIDILNFYGRMYGIEKNERKNRIDSLVKFFGLKNFSNRKFWYLSTGEKMRVTFAKALLNHPKLLLLDEPTLGLDPDIAIRMRDEISRINKKFGTTIILTSHYMNEVEQLADRIAFLDNGELLDTGTVEKVKLRHFSTYDIFITVRNVKDARILRKAGFTVNGNIIQKKIGGEQDIADALSLLAHKKIKIVSIETKKPTLEDYFVKMLGKRSEEE